MPDNGNIVPASSAAAPLSVPPAANTAAAEPTLRHALIGPNGLRAGWRLALYVLFTFALGWLIYEFRRHVMHIPVPPQTAVLDPYREVWSRGRLFLVVATPALIMSRIERAKWGDYGLPVNRLFSRETLVGLLWGFAGLSIVMGCLWALGAYHVDGLAIARSEIWKYAGVWGLGFIFVALFEEFFLRGYMQYTLASGIGFWPAAILLSALFLAAHIGNSGETIYGLTDVFLAGFFFCFTLWRTGNLWFAVGLHAAWDWGLTFFYSVPDSGAMGLGHLLKVRVSGPAWISGGTAGPEGSLINLVFDILWFPLFALLYRQRKWIGLDDRRKAAPGATSTSVAIDTSALSQ